MLAIGGCAAPTPPTTPQPAPTASMPASADAGVPVDAAPAQPVEVVWSIAREHDRLRIDYTVTNHTDATLVLCDRMRSTKGPVDLAVVAPSGSDGVVAFTLAFVRPVGGVIVEVQPRPIAHPLDAHQSTSGTAYVALPLAPYHPIYDPPYELPRDATRAVLEIGYVDGTAPLETERLRAQRYQVPGWAALHAQQLIRGDVLRIP